LLSRRYPVPPDTPQDREKALGFLVRKGFDLELAYDALRRHAADAVER
jgi:regulatory protein